MTLLPLPNSQDIRLSLYCKLLSRLCKAGPAESRTRYLISVVFYVAILAPIRIYGSNPVQPLLILILTSVWRWPRSAPAASAGRRSASRCTRCSEAAASDSPRRTRRSSAAAAVAAAAVGTWSAGGGGSMTAVEGHEAA